MIKIIYSIVLFLFSISAFAQVEKIETDRPGETNNPATVPKKWIQFESGFLRQTQTIGPEKDYYFQHPSLVTKYGIANRFELRLITELASIKQGSFNGYSTITGIHNVQLGGKFNFLKEKGIRPKTSLIAHYDFHRLRTLYKGDSIDGANFRFAMLHTLSNTIVIGYNIGMKWNRFGSPPAYIYTFSPRFNIKEKWVAYIEVFGSFRKQKKYAPENSIGFGIAYYISDNVKIDGSAGFGLSKTAPDNFYAIGTSFRLNTNK